MKPQTKKLPFVQKMIAEYGLEAVTSAIELADDTLCYITWYDEWTEDHTEEDHPDLISIEDALANPKREVEIHYEGDDGYSVDSAEDALLRIVESKNE